MGRYFLVWRTVSLSTLARRMVERLRLILAAATVEEEGHCGWVLGCVEGRDRASTEGTSGMASAEGAGATTYGMMERGSVYSRRESSSERTGSLLDGTWTERLSA